jgi:hypothetical protein
MSPHTTLYVSSYYYMCPHTTMSPLTTMCPATTILTREWMQVRRAKRVTAYIYVRTTRTCLLQCLQLHAYYYYTGDIPSAGRRSRAAAHHQNLRHGPRGDRPLRQPGPRHHAGRLHTLPDPCPLRRRSRLHRGAPREREGGESERERQTLVPGLAGAAAGFMEVCVLIYVVSCGWWPACAAAWAGS